MDNGKFEYNGVGFFGALTILFVALKLCGVIDWAWGWVLAPLWAPLALLAAIVIIALVVGAIVDSK